MTAGFMHKGDGVKQCTGILRLRGTPVQRFFAQGQFNNQCGAQLGGMIKQLADRINSLLVHDVMEDAESQHEIIPIRFETHDDILRPANFKNSIQ